MSMLSEQVKHLRELSNTAKANVYSFEELSQSLKEAADTIESLSAKLTAANIERSDRYYCGGWIACEDSLPDRTNSYIVTKHIDETEDSSEQYEVCTEIFWTIDGKWDCERDDYCEWKVIAWIPKFEPYRP